MVPMGLEATVAAYLETLSVVHDNVEALLDVDSKGSSALMRILTADVVVKCSTNQLVNIARLLFKTAAQTCNATVVDDFVKGISIIVECIVKKETSRCDKSFTKIRNAFARHATKTFSISICNSLVQQSAIVLSLVLVSVLFKQSPNEAEPVVLFLDETLKKRVQGLSKNGPDGTSSLWNDFLLILENSKWESLESILVKSFKKSPESFCGTVLNVVQSLKDSTDLKGMVQQGVLALCIRIMKSEDLALRRDAWKLIYEVVKRLNNDDAFRTVVVTLAEALNGKVPGVAVVSIPTESQKASILLSIFSSLQLKGCLCTSSTVGDVFGALKIYMTKEKDALYLSLSSMCCAELINISSANDVELSVGASGVIDHLKIELEKTLTATNSSMRQSLLVFLVMVACQEKSRLDILKRFEPALLQYVKEVLKKALWSSDAIMAITVLLTCAVHDKGLLEALLASKIFAAVAQSTSFLYSEACFGQLEMAAQFCNFVSTEFPASTEVLHRSLTAKIHSTAWLNLFGSMSRINVDAWERLSAVGSQQLSSVDCTQNLLSVKQSLPVQIFVRSSLIATRFSLLSVLDNTLQLICSTASGKLSLLSALWQELQNSEVLVSMMAQKIESDEKVADRLLLRSAIVKKVLKQLLSVDRSANTVPPIALFSALILSHPFVSGSFEDAQRWFRREYSGLAVSKEAVSESSSVFANALLLVSQQPSAETQLAAHRAVGLLDELFGADKLANHPVLNAMADQAWFLSQYIAALMSQLSDNAILNMTDEDQRIFVNPEREIAEALTCIRDKIEKESSEITNADRKKAGPRSSRKGNFGSDFVEDEEWSEKVRKEKASKLLQAVESTEMVEIKNTILSRKSDLDGQVHRVQRIFSAVKALTLLDKNQARFAANELTNTDIFAQYLRLDIVSDNVFDCLNHLAGHILEDPLRSSCRDIVASLRLACKAQYDQQSLMFFSDKELAGCVLRAMHALQLVVGSSSVLYSTTFSLVFPIFEVIFEFGTSENVVFAFSVLERLWPSSEQIFALSDEIEILEQHAGLRRMLKRVVQSTWKILHRFPRVPSLADRFLVKAVLDCLPLMDEELSLFCAGLLDSEAKVRLSATEILCNITASENDDCIFDAVELSAGLWCAAHDDNTEIVKYAKKIWEIGARNPSKAAVESLIARLSTNIPHLSHCLTRSIAHAMGLFADLDFQFGKFLLESLQSLYITNVPEETVDAPPAKPAAAGKTVILKKATVEKVDATVELRCSVADVLDQLAVQSALSIGVIQGTDYLQLALGFLLEHGCVDVSAEVRLRMTKAASQLVTQFGKTVVPQLAVFLEEILARPAASGANLTKFDHRHAAAVIVLGTLGRHLSKDDALLSKILAAQLCALKTPSESVQRAVADCLVAIAQTLKGSSLAEETLESLVVETLGAEKYGDRRGAAFGVGAFVKGLGIPSMKQHNIMARLKESCESGNISARQGALFAFESLADRLGLLFEPYIASIVDVLLASFSHSSDHVRTAAQGATKSIMNKLSVHGVKQMLSPITNALDANTAWKSRMEAIKMLGMMANCAPKQLAASLPQIVPALVQASFDSHPKVRETAKVAMGDISLVIKNPEIATLCPILLSALADPATKTKDALEALLECEFMHSIDAPSLALVVPILGRALRDRGADQKRKAAAITGNMISMVSDTKSLSPYLSTVIPGLKDCLLDPIPDVRASGAKALGTLYNGIGDGDVTLQDVLKWLLMMLKSHESPVERSGAAQGLAEICGCSVDHSKTDAIVQWVLGFQKDFDNAAREGMMWFLSFLPYALREQFSPYIATSLPIILSGLSDENEGVRDVAMRAGRVIVVVLGKMHSSDLAPALLTGLFQEDWRIRANSLQLLGDLLFLIGDARATGATGDDDDDDVVSNAGSARILAAIRVHLGDAITERVLASIYIARSDVAAGVRQQSLTTWKTVVSNSPRTLVEIMPTLVALLVEQLSADEEELRLIAGRSIGELVAKLGDKVLPAIVRPLQDGLESESESTRLGVCLGLSEILLACTKKQAEDYIDSIIDTVRTALCDRSRDVSAQAAKAFMTLYKNIGNAALVDIVPSLLNALVAGGEQSDLALNGLREIVSLRPRDTLDYLLPLFTSPPMSVVSSRALSAILEVSGNYFYYHFGSLIPNLIREIMDCELKVDAYRQVLKSDQDSVDVSSIQSKIDFEVQREDAVKSAVKSMMSSVSESGVHSFVAEIGAQIEHADKQRRRWGCWMMEQFFSNCKSDYSEYIVVCLKFLVNRVADSDIAVLDALKNAFQALSTNAALDELVKHVEFIRNGISSTASNARHMTETMLQVTATGQFILPLLGLSKSLDPFLTIFLFGLSNGTVHVRELSAEMIGELAEMTSVDVLKPTLVKTVGTLIRVLGERIPSSVKSSVLKTIVVLLERGGQFLKAFAPQLQTTFVKSLSDPLREVRVRGGLALGKLMHISLRVDPLLSELSALCVQADSNAIRLSILDACLSVVQFGGDKASPSALEKLYAVASKNLFDEDESVRTASAKVLNWTAFYLPPDLATNGLSEMLTALKSGLDAPPSIVAGRLIGVAGLVQAVGIHADDYREEVFDLLSMISRKDERIPVKLAAATAIELLVMTPPMKCEERKAEYRQCSQQAVHKLVSSIILLTGFSGSSDVRISAANSIKMAAHHVYGATSQYLEQLFPVLITTVKEIDLRVKYAGDRALKALCDGANKSGNKGTPQFQSFLSRSNGDSQRFMKDYYERVITQMSDTETLEYYGL